MLAVCKLFNDLNKFRPTLTWQRQRCLFATVDAFGTEKILE